MRAAVIRSFDKPTQWLVETLPMRTPAPGEVLIAMRAAAVNFGCVLMAMGGYQVRPLLPFVPGIEGAGIVTAVGKGATRFKPGDRVFAMGFLGDSRQNRRILGSWAEEVLAPEDNVAHVPDAMPLETAALFRTIYETAYFALQRADLQSGQTVLVLGGGGATGCAAIELARAMGAFVIASASSPRKREIALRAGAHAAVDSTSEDWRAAVNAASQGRDVDIVYDPVGGDHTEHAFRTLGWRGTHLMIGFAAGRIPSLPANLPLMKGASMVGVNYLGLLEKEPDLAARNFAKLLELYASGAIRDPVIDLRCCLDNLEEATSRVIGGHAEGRVLLTMNDPSKPASAGGIAATIMARS